MTSALSTESTKLRVLHFINLDVAINVHLRNQILDLKSKGCDVTIMCSPGSHISSDTVTKEGISVKMIEMTRQISPIKDLKTLLELYKYIRSKNFDIVHTHSLKPGLLGRVAAFLAGVPIRIHTIHGFRFHDNMSSVEKRFYILMERIANWFGHISLSQGKDDIDIAIREKICKPGQIFYLGNGIDVSQLTTEMDSAAVQAKKRELGIAPTDKVVGIVGRQTKIKGYFEFIKAAKIVVTKHPQIKLIMIGPSEEGNLDALNVQDLVAKHDLEDFVLHLGRRHDMRELYGIMDVMTLPSWLEGVPRVLIEASMCGKPIVATDIPGNREVVEHELTGLLVPVKDQEALANAILDLLTNSEKASQMGKQGRQRSLELFDERLYLKRLRQTYQDLLDNRLNQKGFVLDKQD